ncbi:hypothetical protein [[Phormidium ambiguum] IAM M-71]|uniref:hypothetical protein n=1 Tax=[Phormidium ambiguum] IAM M-71 TaxID=454136 RepID=UPI0015BE0CAA|nr:hypothetical protein [Phormidium ambiguum]
MPGSVVALAGLLIQTIVDTPAAQIAADTMADPRILWTDILIVSFTLIWLS